MSNSDKVRLVLIGDIFMGGDFVPVCYDKDYDPFKELGKLIKADDIVICNLETTFFKGYQRPFRTPLLWSPPENIRFLESLKLDVACLANNHIMDYGYKSMQRTKRLLANHQIGFFGAGMDLHDSLRPLIIKRNNLTFGFLGFTSKAYYVNALISGWNTPGSPPIKINLIHKQIKSLKEQCDFICICLHWGHEYTNIPTRSQRILAKKIVDAGADLIIGTHPHVIQGFEVIAGKPVFYSLGNFFFPAFETISGAKHTWIEDCHYSMVVLLDIYKDRISSEILPVKFQDNKVVILSGDEKSKILSKLSAYNESMKQGKDNLLYLKDKKKIKKTFIRYLKSRPLNLFKNSLFLLSLFNMFRFIDGLRNKIAKKASDKWIVT